MQEATVVQKLLGVALSLALPPSQRGRYICRSYSSKHWTAWLPVLNSPLSDQLTVSREGIGIGSKLPWGSTVRTLKPNEDSSSVHNNCFADCFSRNVPFLEDVGRCWDTPRSLHPSPCC